MWRLAHAQGDVLDPMPEGCGGYEVPKTGYVLYLDVAGTFDRETGRSCLLVLNRHLDKPRELEVVWRDGAPARVVSADVLTGPDLKAVNSFAEPNRVVPQPLAAPKPRGTRGRAARHGAG